MDIEQKKQLALECCMDIATDYTEEEVKRFALPSVQEAWALGREYLNYELKERKKRIKGLKL